jgi:hypothetical protein
LLEILGTGKTATERETDRKKDRKIVPQTKLCTCNNKKKHTQRNHTQTDKKTDGEESEKRRRRRRAPNPNH